MGSRLKLQTLLEDLLGSRNVYFQPPESVILKYDAIVYVLADIDVLHADDVKYRMYKCYTVTYIHSDPDDPKTDEITALPMCLFDRRFISDNLYHDVYTLYY